MFLYYQLYKFKFSIFVGLILIYDIDLFLMRFLTNLFIVSFGEIDIPPYLFALIIFLSLFVFLAVLISTTKLIQSLVKDSD